MVLLKIRGDMSVGFEDVLKDFPRAFNSVKPMCRKIILFPYKNYPTVV